MHPSERPSLIPDDYGLSRCTIPPSDSTPLERPSLIPDHFQAGLITSFGAFTYTVPPLLECCWFQCLLLFYCGVFLFIWTAMYPLCLCNTVHPLLFDRTDEHPPPHLCLFLGRQMQFTCSKQTRWSDNLSYSTSSHVSQKVAYYHSLNYHVGWLLVLTSPFRSKCMQISVC